MLRPVMPSTPDIGSRRLLLWGSALVVLLVGVTLRLVQIGSYPPGFHYDEAVNFIVSREIAVYGARPFPVFAAFNGREVFYFYVNALAMLGIGQHIFTMHVVSIMMNLITLAATIGLGRAMFGRQRGLVLGLLAAGFMAVSFPQIFMARQAFRAVSQPMLQALCLWALFVGLQKCRRGWLWLVVSGVLGAAVLYTYMAARLFPGWVGLVLLVVWLLDKDWRRLRLQQGVVVMGMLVMVALPIIHYYTANPDVFADRLDQLSAGDDTLSYAESVWLHVKMFFIEGDPYVRYNDPAAPYFDPISGLLLLVGLASVLWGIPRSTNAVERGAYALIACAPLMVVPSVLAVGGLPPSHMRSIGMVPLIFFLPALGVEIVWRAIQRQRSGRYYPIAYPILGAWGILLIAAVLVWGRYRDWASNPELYYLTDSDMVAAGAWLEDHSTDETLMYVTSQHYDHPSLLIHDLPGDNITFLVGNRVFLPPPDHDAYLIDTANRQMNYAWRATVEAEFGSGEQHSEGFTVYHWQNSTPTPQMIDETIGGWLSLREAVLPDGVSGRSIVFTTAWKIIHAPPYEDFTPIFQLETPYGDVLGRDEPFTQHSTRWRPGEVLIQQTEFWIPDGTPPGEYPVRVTWVGRTADQYAGRIDSQGNFAGIWLDLGMVTVQRPDSFLPPIDTSQYPPSSKVIDMAPGVRLRDWWSPPASVRPGERLDFDLLWQAIDGQRSQMDIIVLARPPDGEDMVLWEGAPVMDSYPFTEWIVGEPVMDRHRWRLPTDFPAGDYQLVVALGDSQVVVGDFTVLEVNRQFDAPDPATTLNLNLGDMVGLVGYDLSAETLSSGDSFHLILYWQSITMTDLPLTVFVHLVGPDGITYDQRDMQPRQNSYPVSLWVPDEYVDDSYTLTLPDDAPPGVYTLRVGMYLQASGLRLAISTPNDDSSGDYWELGPITVE